MKLSARALKNTVSHRTCSSFPEQARYKDVKFPFALVSIVGQIRLVRYTLQSEAQFTPRPKSVEVMQKKGDNRKKISPLFVIYARLESRVVPPHSSFESRTFRTVYKYKNITKEEYFPFSLSLSLWPKNKVKKKKNSTLNFHAQERRFIFCESDKR